MKASIQPPAATRTGRTRSRSAAEPGIEADITRRVRRSKPETVFTPALLACLGSRAAIDKAMQRLVARGEPRRLSRGLYDKPRQDALLGTLWPSVDAIVAALTGKDKLLLLPTAAYAANLLGLSDQVPARVESLTDGTSRTVRAGPMQIVLKRTTPRQMAAAGRSASGAAGRSDAGAGLDAAHLARARLGLTNGQARLAVRGTPSGAPGPRLRTDRGPHGGVERDGREGLLSLLVARPPVR